MNPISPAPAIALMCDGSTGRYDEATSGEIAFLVPGDLGQLSGGYGYARALMTAWRRQGVAHRHVALAGDFPYPSPASLDETGRILAALPADAPVLIDGLAHGVMTPELLACCPAPIFVLHHHPLGLETGLTRETAELLVASERAALAVVSGVVVTSPETGRTVRELFGVAEDRLCVAVPGLTRRPIAQRASKPPRILSVASLIPRKGHLDLIAALEGVAELDWRAEFVGSLSADPATVAAIGDAIEESGLAERIFLTGPLGGAELDRRYEEASIFALASHYEGYGMAFAEAMSAGLPIVGYRGGAVPELVPQHAGLLVEPGDIEGLAEALARLLGDEEAAASMARGAHEASLTLPVWDETAARIAAFMNVEAAKP